MKKVEISYQVPFSIDKLMRFFLDLRKYATLHPLILSAESLNVKHDKFKIIERPFKFVPYIIHYFAEVSSVDNRISYLVTGIPLAVVNITYDFIALEKHQTKIGFALEIKGKLPVKSILLKKMIKAQNQLMEALKSQKTFDLVD